jgi:hypothetical protein
VLAEAGIRGAYTAGSTNWLPAGAELPAGSDLDIMILDAGRAGSRRKLLYGGVLLEASYLTLPAADGILGDYHLAPSLATGQILLDPTGSLAALQAEVRGSYADPAWIRRRVDHARAKLRANLRAEVVSCLFAAGIATHMLLAAGLRNPTVRNRYVAVRQLVEPELHESLLGLLGSAHLDAEAAGRHLAALEPIFDAAVASGQNPFPDIGAIARPAAIDASRTLIARGLHREAMFWIAVTHARCRKVLGADTGAWRALLTDLGLATDEDLRRRAAAIEAALPLVTDSSYRLISKGPGRPAAPRSSPPQR